MLMSVNSLGTPALYWASSPDVSKRLSLMPTSSGALAFPDVGPLGGTLLTLPLVVSNALESGTLALLDAASVVAESGPIKVDTSEAGTIEMSDDPAGSSTAPTASSHVSLWQSNAMALRCTASFGIERLRGNAFVVCNQIGWGGEVTS